MPKQDRLKVVRIDFDDVTKMIRGHAPIPKYYPKDAKIIGAIPILRDTAIYVIVRSDSYPLVNIDGLIEKNFPKEL